MLGKNIKKIKFLIKELNSKYRSNGKTYILVGIVGNALIFVFIFMHRQNRNRSIYFYINVKVRLILEICEQYIK